ncbi:prephenate dehydrogenase [Cloacibacillus sp.]
MGFKITIAGLGLMGASLAKALRGWRNAGICGVETDAAVLARAQAEGVIDKGYVLDETNAREALDADLVVIALYPRAALNFLRGCARCAKEGALWSDLTGIKGALIEEARRSMPAGAEFLGAHPMAGRESSGYAASDGKLFTGCNFIIMPHEKNSRGAVSLLREMAAYAGAARVIETTPEKHDRMIAYTSQMAHVLTAAILNSGLLFESKGFEGGSFRDLTRVGTLNPEMWSELFSMNAAPLGGVLAELENNIAALRGLVESGNQSELEAALAASTRRKEEYLKAPYAAGKESVR